jgi:CO dehydrogenase maturation factor
VTLSLAIAGKGGIGKTTFSALVIRALMEMQLRPVLAVDADPNANLAEALGVEAGTPLAEIREQGSSPEGSPASGIGRVRAIDDEIQRAIAEADGFDLVTMGRPEGPRCYCYVNNLLRRSLDSLAAGYAAVVVDNEAGMEHLSRRTTNNVDFLILVTDPTLPALRAVKRILALSRELPIQVGQRVLLVNRVGLGPMPEPVARELDRIEAPRLPDVPQDDRVEQAGAAGQNVFTLPAGSPGVQAVNSVVQALRAMSAREKKTR